MKKKLLSALSLDLLGAVFIAKIARPVSQVVSGPQVSRAAVSQLNKMMGVVKKLEKYMKNIRTDSAGDNLFHYMVKDYRAVENQDLVGELLDVLKAVNKDKLKAALNQKNERGKDPSDIAPSWMKIEVGRHN